MKIIFFSSDCNIHSGAFRAEINLIKDLQKNGHEITLVLPYRSKGNKLAKKLNIKTKTILSTPWVCNKNKNIFSVLAHICSAPINLLATIRTKKYLKKHKFDLAVVNTLWNGIGGNQSIKLGIPTVWHLREILETGQNKRFYNKKKSYLIINKSNVCISVSNSVKKFYESKLSKVKIINIYDGVDASIFYDKNRQIFKDDTSHILLLGIVKKHKGQHIALKALNQLTNYNFDVKIVGQCSRIYKNKLLKLIPNIRDRVEFVGPTSTPDKFYKWSDIFLMNSPKEAFGLVTVEAMMSNNIVIGVKTAGTLEIIKSNQHGIFYEPSNVNDLMDKLKNVFDNKKHFVKVAKNGQNRAVANFDKTTNSKLIEKIYLSQIKKAN